MVEGLAGIKDAPKTEAFSEPILAPRWTTTNSDSVNVTVRYAASKGYVSYQYHLDSLHHRIYITATTGGNKMLFHVLLPPKTKATTVLVNKNKIAFTPSAIEESNYADFEVDATNVEMAVINYE
jgi:hypothetical protein